MSNMTVPLRFRFYCSVKSN